MKKLWSTWESRWLTLFIGSVVLLLVNEFMDRAYLNLLARGMFAGAMFCWGAVHVESKGSGRG